MIQELREYSKSIFFKILLGIIAITFVLSFGVGGFFGDRKEVIAIVNDNEILLREYRAAYQNRIQSLRQQFGESADQIAEQINDLPRGCVGLSNTGCHRTSPLDAPGSFGPFHQRRGPRV